MLQVDDTTLTASHGKFAYVCVEIDLSKPLKAGYNLRDQTWKVQYEGLHTLCFHYGRYDHTGSSCPSKPAEERIPEASSKHQHASKEMKETVSIIQAHEDQLESIFGSWTLVKKIDGGRKKLVMAVIQPMLAAQIMVLSPLAPSNCLHKNKANQMRYQQPTFQNCHTLDQD